MHTSRSNNSLLLAENAWFAIRSLFAAASVPLSIGFVFLRWFQFRTLAHHIDGTPWFEIGLEYAFALSGLIYLVMFAAPFAGRAPGTVRFAISLLLAVGALLILAVEVPACWSYWTDLAQWTGPRRMMNAATLAVFGGTLALCSVFAVWLSWPRRGRG